MNETMIIFDNSIEEAAKVLEVRFMKNDVLDANLAGEEDNIEESKMIYLKKNRLT